MLFSVQTFAKVSTLLDSITSVDVQGQGYHLSIAKDADGVTVEGKIPTGGLLQLLVAALAAVATQPAKGE